MASEPMTLDDALEIAAYLAEHADECVLAWCQGGEPTEDGGYRVKYDEKWYPSDSKPPCTCGRDEAAAVLERFRAALPELEKIVANVEVGCTPMQHWGIAPHEGIGIGCCCNIAARLRAIINGEAKEGGK